MGDMIALHSLLSPLLPLPFLSLSCLSKHFNQISRQGQLTLFPETEAG